jgi:hypothetical protein
VLALAGAAQGSGALGAGPQLGALSFTATGPTAGTLLLDVTLATKGSPAVPSPIVAATFAAAAVTLQKFDSSTGWSDASPSVSFLAASSQIALDVTGLTSGTRYRLSIDQPFAQPLADDQGRAVSPTRYARLLAFVADSSGTTLQLDPAL